VHATAPMVRFVHIHKKPESRIYLLLNKVRPGKARDVSVERALAHQLGVPLASCVLPYSQNFEDIQTNGWPALNRRQQTIVRRLALELVS